MINLERKREYIVSDSIDLQVEILPVPIEKLLSMADGEPSAAIRERVVRAREIQARRYAAEPHVHCNAQMNSRLLKQYCFLDEECTRILKHAMTKYDMSARAYDRILKVARTIADLDYAATLESCSGSLSTAVNSPITPRHIREAISYRNLDRSSWGTSLG